MKIASVFGWVAAASAAGALCLSVPGCGESLHDDPVNAPYVAPDSPGEMKPEPKKDRQRRQQGGVPLDS